MAEHQDLQFLRPTRAGEQRHEREQAANRKVDKRPEEARTSQSTIGKSPDTIPAEAAPSQMGGHARVCEPLRAMSRAAEAYLLTG